MVVRDGVHSFRLLIWAACLCRCAFAWVPNAVYWINWGTGSLQRATLDGTDVEDVRLESQGMAKGLAIDEANCHIFWASENDQTIKMGLLDGSNSIVFQILTSRPNQLKRVRDTNMLYWVQTDSRIYRVSMDAAPGAVPEELDTYDSGTSVARKDIAIDYTVDPPMVFWVEEFFVKRKVWGTAVGDFEDEIFIDADLDEHADFVYEPMALALDLLTRKMYVFDNEFKHIFRVSLDDPTDVEVFIETPGRIVTGMAVDAARGFLYYTDNNPINNNVHKIRLSDGSEVWALTAEDALSRADPSEETQPFDVVLMQGDYVPTWCFTTTTTTTTTTTSITSTTSTTTVTSTTTTTSTSTTTLSSTTTTTTTITTTSTTISTTTTTTLSSTTTTTLSSTTTTSSTSTTTASTTTTSSTSTTLTTTTTSTTSSTVTNTTTLAAESWVQMEMTVLSGILTVTCADCTDLRDSLVAEEEPTQDAFKEAISGAVEGAESDDVTLGPVTRRLQAAPGKATHRMLQGVVTDFTVAYKIRLRTTANIEPSTVSDNLGQGQRMAQLATALSERAQVAVLLRGMRSSVPTEEVEIFYLPITSTTTTTTTVTETWWAPAGRGAGIEPTVVVLGSTLTILAPTASRLEIEDAAEKAWRSAFDPDGLRPMLLDASKDVGTWTVNVRISYIPQESFDYIAAVDALGGDYTGVAADITARLDELGVDVSDVAMGTVTAPEVVEVVHLDGEACGSMVCVVGPLLTLPTSPTVTDVCSQAMTCESKDTWCCQATINPYNTDVGNDQTGAANSSAIAILAAMIILGVCAYQARKYLRRGAQGQGPHLCQTLGSMIYKKEKPAAKAEVFSDVSKTKVRDAIVNRKSPPFKGTSNAELDEHVVNLIIEDLQGDWALYDDNVLVPGTVLIGPGGVTLYDGRHWDSQDLIAKPTGIQRVDGWYVDMGKSDTDHLEWRKDGEEGITWKRRKGITGFSAGDAVEWTVAEGPVSEHARGTVIGFTDTRVRVEIGEQIIDAKPSEIDVVSKAHDNEPGSQGLPTLALCMEFKRLNLFATELGQENTGLAVENIKLRREISSKLEMLEKENTRVSKENERLRGQLAHADDLRREMTRSLQIEKENATLSTEHERLRLRLLQTEAIEKDLTVRQLQNLQMNVQLGASPRSRSPSPKGEGALATRLAVNPIQTDGLTEDGLLSPSGVLPDFFDVDSDDTEEELIAI